jgi:hypothetical protein
MFVRFARGIGSEVGNFTSLQSALLHSTPVIPEMNFPILMN